MLQHFSSCNNISLIFQSFVILGQIYTNIKDTHITYIWKLLKIEDAEKGQSAFYRVTRCVSNKLALWWCSVLCSTLWDPMNYSLPGSMSIEFSRQEYWRGYRFLLWGIFWPRQHTHISWVSCIGRQILYNWAIWEAPCWSFPNSIVVSAE